MGKQKQPFTYEVAKQEVIAYTWSTEQGQLLTTGTVSNGKRVIPINSCIAYDSRDAKVTIEQAKQKFECTMGAFLEVVNLIQAEGTPMNLAAGLMLTIPRDERSAPFRLNPELRLEIGTETVDYDDNPNAVAEIVKKYRDYLRAPSVEVWRDLWNKENPEVPAKFSALTGDNAGAFGSEISVRGAKIQVYHFFREPHVLVETRFMPNSQMAEVLKVVQAVVDFKMPEPRVEQTDPEPEQLKSEVDLI